jgi:hypothetical protein
VIIFILAVIIYRTLASIYLFSNKNTRPVAQILASTSGAVVSFSMQHKCSVVAPLSFSIGKKAYKGTVRPDYNWLTE